MTDSFENPSSVLFTRIPIPPSSNKQYTVSRGRFVPSSELVAFKREMNQYPALSKDMFFLGRQAIHSWLNEGLALEVRCIFFLKRERIFTKKGTPKKLDVSNRLKALHDSLCELIDIDDSLFFKVYAEKAECHENLEEMVCVEILPCE